MRNFEEETKIREFIQKYLAENPSTSATDEIFQEEFHLCFGGKRKLTCWGAQTSFNAQRWLKRLYSEGTLQRCIIPLGKNWQPGFPKWVYEYFLPRRED